MINPLTPYLLYIKIALFVGLLGALGVQSYRLQGTQGELKMEVQARLERDKRDALRAGFNLRNKERTDEEYSSAVARARAGGLRDGEAIGISLGEELAFADFGDESAACFDRRILLRNLAEWGQRTASRLAEILTTVAERHTGRLEEVARSGEEVAAGMRACAAWGLSLVGGPLPPEAGRPLHAAGVPAALQEPDGAE